MYPARFFGNAENGASDMRLAHGGVTIRRYFFGPIPAARRRPGDDDSRRQ